MSEHCMDCMTARTRFRIGDKVVLNVEGCRQLPEFIKNKSRGTVVGFGRGYNLVRIKFQFLVNPQTTHCGFWDRA